MRSRHLLAVLVALVVTLASTAVANGVTSSPAKATHYTDREMILGLVYGVGDLAAELNVEVKQAQNGALAAKHQQYEAVARRSAGMMLSEHRAELAPALANLRSGEVLRVERGLAGLGKVVNDFSEQQLAKQGKTLKDVARDSDNSTQACGVALVCVAYAAAAVHNTVVITGLAAVVVGGALWCGVWKWCAPGANSTTTKTAKERFMLDIAQTVS